MKTQRGNIILEELLIIVILVGFVLIHAWPALKPLFQAAAS